MIDWALVKHRLRESEALLNRSLDDDPERLAAVLRERAVRLAARQERASQVATSPVIEFALDAERFAILLDHVSQVMPLAGFTPLPGAPAALLGVTNLRGDICSVVDLRRLLNLPDRAADAAGFLLVLRLEIGAIAVRVDGIERVRQIDLKDLLAPNAELVRFHSRHVLGVTPDRLIVLNMPLLAGEFDALAGSERDRAADEPTMASAVANARFAAADDDLPRNNRDRLMVPEPATT